MEKIEFKNNSEPYLSAENLNKMQENAEVSIEEVKQELEEYKKISYSLSNTVSGESVTIEDAVEYKLLNLEIDGKSTQETRSGYNFLLNNGTSTTINGITFTVNEDKSITMNGTATDNANFPIFGTGWNITDEQITLATGTYFTIGTGTNNAIVYCRDGINNINVATQLNNVQVTNQLALITYAFIQVPSGKTVSNETLYPMIVKGEYTKDTFPKYEQYGISPSPDYPSEIESVGTYNEETSKYEIEVKVSNGTDTNTTVLALNKPLRSLPNGVKDIAYIKNNKLYVDRYVGSVILNGSENWEVQWNTEDCHGWRVALENGITYSNDMSVINPISSDYFKTYAQNSLVANTGAGKSGICGRANNKHIIILYNDITSTNDFKTWLSNNNVQIDYELDTPVTEEIGDCVINTYAGVNNIDLEANLETEFSVTYVQDIKILLQNYVTKEEMKNYVDSQLGTINEQLASLTEVE